jgi:hypothetical protein
MQHFGVDFNCSDLFYTKFEIMSQEDVSGDLEVVVFCDFKMMAILRLQF